MGTLMNRPQVQRVPVEHGHGVHAECRLVDHGHILLVVRDENQRRMHGRGELLGRLVRRALPLADVVALIEGFVRFASLRVALHIPDGRLDALDRFVARDRDTRL